VTTGDTDLGTVLTTADGLTLYGFTDDTDGTSTCTGDCAQTWPPLLVEEDFVVGDGLDATVFTTTERDDGSLQLVAGDWPLYTFAGDQAPGDVNGQGVGDVWFAVTPDGQLIEDDAADGGDSASGTGPGTDY
jgi:predicted lipoprotein with Yx(FWY)xxD motif